MNLSRLPQINLSELDYDLPTERIAEFPLEDRSASKLLIADVAERQIRHSHFSDVVSAIPPHALLVMNNTRVIRARLEVMKLSGGAAEVLCLNPVEPSKDPGVALQARETAVWDCLIGGKKIKAGDVLKRALGQERDLTVEVLEKSGAEARVRFRWDKDAGSFGDLLEQLGRMPLPPYIKREDVEADCVRYQTVYAKREGSVAAPTAGLHFTPQILSELARKQVDILEATLHVGAGTFKPVQTENVAEHVMHSERVITSRELIARLAQEGAAPVVAVGTTSLRTLESLYCFALEVRQDPDAPLTVSQWGWREWGADLPTRQEAMTVLLQWMDAKKFQRLSLDTQLMVVPGYPFHMVDALITNFHQPRSTLILLVAAFAGKDLWRRMYNEALANGYRFLSYGDSSLILRTVTS